jgi:hypothetical protein
MQSKQEFPAEHPTPACKAAHASKASTTHLVVPCSTAFCNEAINMWPTATSVGVCIDSPLILACSLAIRAIYAASAETLLLVCGSSRTCKSSFSTVSRAYCTLEAQCTNYFVCGSVLHCRRGSAQSARGTDHGVLHGRPLCSYQPHRTNTDYARCCLARQGAHSEQGVPGDHCWRAAWQASLLLSTSLHKH